MVEDAQSTPWAQRFSVKCLLTKGIRDAVQFCAKSYQAAVIPSPCHGTKELNEHDLLSSNMQ